MLRQPRGWPRDAELEASATSRPRLWVQKAIRDERFTLHKEKGEDNVADLGTKHVETQTMWKLLNKMGLYAAAGRSKLALKAAL